MTSDKCPSVPRVMGSVGSERLAPNPTSQRASSWHLDVRTVCAGTTPSQGDRWELRWDHWPIQNHWPICRPVAWNSTKTQTPVQIFGTCSNRAGDVFVRRCYEVPQGCDGSPSKLVLESVCGSVCVLHLEGVDVEPQNKPFT